MSYLQNEIPITWVVLVIKAANVSVSGPSATLCAFPFKGIETGFWLERGPGQNNPERLGKGWGFLLRW